MPNDPKLPKTTADLEAEIAALTKSLADRDGLSKTETAALVARLDKLEAALAAKPAIPPSPPLPAPPPKPRRQGILPWLDEDLGGTEPE